MNIGVASGKLLSAIGRSPDRDDPDLDRDLTDAVVNEVAMTDERAELGAALNRASAPTEDPGADPEKIAENLADLKRRCEGKIDSLHQQVAHAEEEFQGIKARTEAAIDRQRRVIAMIDAAIRAGQPKIPAKRARKSKRPAKSAATAPDAPPDNATTETANA